MIYISIIVPVFQVSSFLERGIDCLINQDLDDEYEIILVDDGSTDGSSLICDKYASKFEKIKVVHQSNRGVSSARNVGIQLSKGKYIAFFDPDDWVESNYYSRMLTAIRCDRCDIVFSKYSRVLENGQIIDNDEECLEQAIKSNTVIREIIGNVENGVFKRGRSMGVVWRSLFCSDIIRNYKITFNEKVSLSEDQLFLASYLCHVSYCKLIEGYGYKYCDRTSSATVERYKNNLCNIRKECIKQLQEILTNCSCYTEIDQVVIENSFRYIYAKEIISNEFRFSSEPVSSMEVKKSISQIITWGAIRQLLINGESKEDFLLLLLGKMRCFGLVNFLYYLRRKRNHGNN